MALTLLSGFPVFAASTNSNASTCITTAADTTGADLFVAARSSFNDRNGSTGVDDAGTGANTWTALTKQLGPSSDSTAQLFYVAAPTTNANHVFRAANTSAASYDVLWVWAFSGSAASPFRNESGNTENGSANFAPSAAIGANGDVVIAVVSDELNTGTAQAFGSSFVNSTSYGFVGGTHGSGVGAHKFTSGTEQPTASGLGGTDAAIAIAAFKAAAGGAAFLAGVPILGRQAVNRAGTY